MIIGIGVDLVEIKRIKRLLLRRKSELKRIFTPSEIKYCRSKKLSFESFAGRFASKEAFLKAIGTGWGTKQSPKWTDIEVVNKKQPVFKLSGKAQLIRRHLKINKLHLSISHTKEHAVAFVVLEK